jgi:WD40 repeat protein
VRWRSARTASCSPSAADPATGRRVGASLQTGSGPATGVYGLAFCPDGTVLAASCGDGSLWLWNPATGRPVGAPIQTDVQYGVIGVAFSPGGKLLASGGANGKVRLWRTAPFVHPYRALCSYVGAPTPQEWDKYAAGEPQPKVCR